MKCSFCGEEGMMNAQAGSEARTTIVYDPKKFAYFAVRPAQYLICRKCGRTETFSSLREMGVMEVESERMSR